MAARASWDFALCDSGGNQLAILASAGGRTIAAKRNTYTETQFTLSHQDDEAQLLLDSLKNTGIPQLKGYRRGPNDTSGQLRFRGYLAPFSEDAEETSTLTCVFRSPFSRLLGDGSNRGYFTAPSVIFTAQDAGSGIAIPLLNTANAQGATGLIPGTVQATKVRDRTYQNANVGEEITALTNVLDGFDFEEVFVDGVGSTMAALNIYPSQGSVRPLAKFEYGSGTLANVRNVKRTTEPPINQVTIIGGNGLTSTKQDTGSIAKYGLWPYQETLSTVLEQTTLDDHATSRLRPNPVKTLDFTPEFATPNGNCPQPWDDFWLGDTVPLYVRRSAFTESVNLRLNAITVAISDDGFESAEIPDPTSPDAEATIRSNLSVEVV